MPLVNVYATTANDLLEAISSLPADWVVITTEYSPAGEYDGNGWRRDPNIRLFGLNTWLKIGWYGEGVGMWFADRLSPDAQPPRRNNEVGTPVTWRRAALIYSRSVNLADGVHNRRIAPL